MICRYQIFYLFLLIVPFFNIIGKNFGSGFVMAFVLCYLIVTTFLFKSKKISAHWSSLLLYLGVCITCLLISEVHSVLNLGSSNNVPIRFFGLSIFVLVFYIYFYNPNVFADRYLDKLLRFYICIFSLSITVDFIILHSSLDISLQPMYGKEDWSYFSRPFGITGQPSVNSILLVFFYALLSSRNKFKKIKISFIFMLIGIVLQGSGSGFIALLMLLASMANNSGKLTKVLVFSCFGYISIALVQNIKTFDKISFEYISGITQVFMWQIDDWILLVQKSYPFLSLFFGGVSSDIDFGPLYFVSNVGLIYFTLYLSLIFIIIWNAKNNRQRLAIYILLVGNLHYPVMFYQISTIFLPLIIHYILASMNVRITSSSVKTI